MIERGSNAVAMFAREAGRPIAKTAVGVRMSDVISFGTWVLRKSTAQEERQQQVALGAAVSRRLEADRTMTSRRKAERHMIGHESSVASQA